MENDVKRLRQFIDSAKTIMVTSHISPDPDALASLILIGTTLKLNFPKKHILMVLEDEPHNLKFLTSYNQVIFADVYEEFTKLQPNLLIIVDTNNYQRVSRNQSEKLRELISVKKTPVAIIDHHEPDNKDSSEVYINRYSPAASQEVYQTFYEDMRLNKPPGYAEAAMLGLYSDSGGFMYVRQNYADTFKIAKILIDDGASIERINNSLHQYTRDDMLTFSELAANVQLEADYVYSFLRDEFVDQWLADGKTPESLHKATELFINKYVRNIEGRKWGFIVYRNELYGPGVYSCSLRAVSEVKDVSRIAAKLHGGGHKPAAGGRIYAKSVEQAISQAKVAIAGNHIGA